MPQANDSILVTPGTGATVATHLVNGKEYQVIIPAADDGYIVGTKDTYVASYRLSAETSASALTHSFTANAEKQFATIFHTSSATKTVCLRRVELFIASTATALLNVELRYLNGTTAPATGNPAITPRATHPGSPSAEATCLALPTTAGSVPASQPIFTQELNLGVNTALTTTYPTVPIALWPAAGDLGDVRDPTMRASTAEGWTVSLRSNAAVVIKATVRIIFTEA